MFQWKQEKRLIGLVWSETAWLNRSTEPDRKRVVQTKTGPSSAKYETAKYETSKFQTANVACANVE